LTPWLNSLDLLASSQGDSFYENQITELLHKLYYVERMMAHKAMNRVKFDAAEGHCQRYLIYSRRYKVEGEEKTTAIYNSLTALCALRRHQCNYSEAATFAEEAYNLVCIAYNPVHLEVQEAAGILIDILIINGDIYNAERFSQQTYENLHAPANGINQISEEVAQSAYQLAMVTNLNKDFEKAEKLVKEALDIRIIGFKGAILLYIYIDIQRYTFIFVCTYVYTSIYVCICIYINMYVCIYTYINIYVCMYIYIYINIKIYI
jgi:hypothetical protein